MIDTTLASNNPLLLRKLVMKKCNIILTEKQQKYQNYHHVKLINMDISQSKTF